jgi:hypothetical protein
MAGRVDGKVAFITGAVPCAAHSVGAVRGHQQRGALPGLRESRYITGVPLPIDAGSGLK